MDWKKQVVYQIFVDRFKRGPHFSQRVAEGVYHRDGGVVKEWNEIPSKAAKGMEFFGGDLEGIIEELNYVRSLGVNVLYLTPIFLASTNHKYDTHDFVVDPQFGNEEVLKKLIREAHKRGMAVLLDGVFNHVGADGKWFNRAKKYGNDGAYNAEKSEYRDFFYFEEWPKKYRGWYDVKLLPELNLENEKLCELLFTGENAVVKRYLKLGIDGWRLDCAHDLGHEINKLIRKSAKDVNPNSYIVGEISTYPKAWLKDDELDGVMNYYFANVVLGGLNGIYTPLVMKSELDRMIKEIGVDKLSTSWNMLSSHDTPRLKRLLKDEKSRKMAVAFQIAYPGNPFLYYGEENGMDGGEDPDNRRPMIWEEEKWDKGFRKFIMKAMKLKTSEPALMSGNYLALPISNSHGIVGFARYTDNPEDTVFFFANLSFKKAKEEIPIPLSYFLSHASSSTLLGEGEVQAKISSLEVTLPARSFIISKLISKFENYRMYKYLRKVNNSDF